MDDRSNHADVGMFHEKFGLDNTTCRPIGPRLSTEEFLEFRIDFMKEELKEFIDAAQTGDHAKMFDSLIDLAYVVHGTAHMLGYPWQAGWDLVQAANMIKERATRSGQSHREAWKLDVIKPGGWEPPNIEGLLKLFGWGGMNEMAGSAQK